MFSHFTSMDVLLEEAELEQHIKVFYVALVHGDDKVSKEVNDSQQIGQ